MDTLDCMVDYNQMYCFEPRRLVSCIIPTDKELVFVTAWVSNNRASGHIIKFCLLLQTFIACQYLFMVSSKL